MNDVILGERVKMDRRPVAGFAIQANNFSPAVAKKDFFRLKIKSFRNVRSDLALH